ncbi:hypothetical protein EDB83DRAFT_2324242 [Lactarius deliciosus]|nr:hypothetical protein EDB83DRAFT_2324242 [Lactarius deliciosus]
MPMSLEGGTAPSQWLSESQIVPQRDELNEVLTAQPPIPNEGAQKQRLRATSNYRESLTIVGSARLFVGHCGGQKWPGATSVRNEIPRLRDVELSSNFFLDGTDESRGEALGEDESRKESEGPPIKPTLTPVQPVSHNTRYTKEVQGVQLALSVAVRQRRYTSSSYLG